MLTEKEAFTEGVRACEQKMYLLALGIVQNEADAADVMQDAILKAYCNLSQLRDRNKFQSWMLSIVHNTAIEALRKRRDTVELDSQYDLQAPSPGLDHAAKLTVWEAVQALPLPYRTGIILFYYDGYSVRQISGVTGASQAAVRQQLSRGRKLLAQMLSKEDFDL